VNVARVRVAGVDQVAEFLVRLSAFSDPGGRFGAVDMVLTDGSNVLGACGTLADIEGDVTCVPWFTVVAHAVPSQRVHGLITYHYPAPVLDFDFGTFDLNGLDPANFPDLYIVVRMAWVLGSGGVVTVDGYCVSEQASTLDFSM